MRADSNKSCGRPSKKLLRMKIAQAQAQTPLPLMVETLTLYLLYEVLREAEKERISDQRLSISRMPKKFVNMM